jgi:peptidoglycan/LPS O-acetylase OafA/YrhL
MTFNPILHGLRGMAAMMVLLYHWKESYPAFAGAYRQLPFLGTKWNLFLPADFGWMGVHWFFVLSGYLLSANIWHRPLNAMEVRQFWERRFVRIYPAVWVQIPIILLAIYGVNGYLDVRWQSLLGNALLWVVPYTGGVAAYNGVWWTLPIELGFYLLLPALMGFYRRFGWTVTFWLVAAISSGWKLWVILDHEGANYHSAMPWMRALPAALIVFLCGFYVSHRQHLGRPQRAGAGPWLLLGVVALFYGWLQLLIQHRKTIFFEPGLLAASDPVMAALIAAVIAVLLRPDMAHSWVNRILASRPMHWLGEWSYGIYLWHYLCLRWIPKLFPGDWGGVNNSAFALAACLLFTLPAAALSYFLVERPALAWLARRQETRRSAATPPH